MTILSPDQYAQLSEEEKRNYDAAVQRSSQHRSRHKQMNSELPAGRTEVKIEETPKFPHIPNGFGNYSQMNK